MRDLYARSGVLVRLVRGRRHQSFRIPGRVTPRSWRFAGGVCVVDVSLSDAIERAYELLGIPREDEECQQCQPSVCIGRRT